MTSSEEVVVNHCDNEPEAGPSKGILAVDMDDVLCTTNETIVHMHNDIFGVQPPLTLDDFENYLYWRNRGWGDPTETVRMVTKLYAQGLYMKAALVPGAKEGLLRLKEMGYSLIIITARSEKQREGTEDWIAENLPDIFDEIHFTGAFQHLDPTAEEKEGHVAKRAVVSFQKRAKSEIVHSTGALLLIDDSGENAIAAATASPPVKVLLFGDYPWNAVMIRPGEETEEDAMTYVEKVDRGVLDRAKARREELKAEGWLPPAVERVKNWKEIVGWVERYERGQASLA